MNIREMRNEKSDFPYGACLLIFIGLSVGSARSQLQSEFGQSLLEKEPEPSETDPAELTISSHLL